MASTDHMRTWASGASCQCQALAPGQEIRTSGSSDKTLPVGRNVAAVDLVVSEFACEQRCQSVPSARVSARGARGCVPPWFSQRGLMRCIVEVAVGCRAASCSGCARLGLAGLRGGREAELKGKCFFFFLHLSRCQSEPAAVASAASLSPPLLAASSRDCIGNVGHALGDCMHTIEPHGQAQHQPWDCPTSSVNSRARPPSHAGSASAVAVETGTIRRYVGIYLHHFVFYASFHVWSMLTLHTL
jgi:hypothetical protein